MKKLNTKGFGIVEGLLIAFIVCMIGGTIFYVWKVGQANNKIATPNIPVSLHNPKDDRKPTNIKTDLTVDPSEAREASPDKRLKFSNELAWFSFKYPANWTIQDCAYELEASEDIEDSSIKFPRQNMYDLILSPTGKKISKCDEDNGDDWADTSTRVISVQSSEAFPDESVNYFYPYLFSYDTFMYGDNSKFVTINGKELLRYEWDYTGSDVFEDGTKLHAYLYINEAENKQLLVEYLQKPGANHQDNFEAMIETLEIE